MTAVGLRPEHERLVAEIVAKGRYRDVTDVVNAALEALRLREGHRDELLASIVAAEEDGERNGFLTLHAVMLDADAVIAEMASSRR